MPSRRATVRSPEGLHARPAAALARKVAAAGLEVSLSRAPGNASDEVDAASMLEVMSLGLAHGDTVTLRCEEPSSAMLLDELGRLIETSD